MSLRDKKFIDKISKIRSFAKEKEKPKEFTTWITKHEDDLKNMYDDCNVSLVLSYADFLDLAYRCSEKCSC